MPSGAVRRLAVLCSPAPCFVVFPRAVCFVLCQSCPGLLVRAVVRRCALCCVCVLCASWGVVLRVSCPHRSVRCCIAWCLVLWCVAVCCALSCGVLWCGAGSGCLLLSCGGVFRCRSPCLAAWSAALWLMWFAVVPCSPVLCSVVLCCDGVLCCRALLFFGGAVCVCSFFCCVLWCCAAWWCRAAVLGGVLSFAVCVSPPFKNPCKNKTIQNVYFLKQKLYTTQHTHAGMLCAVFSVVPCSLALCGALVPCAVWCAVRLCRAVACCAAPCCAGLCCWLSLLVFARWWRLCAVVPLSSLPACTRHIDYYPVLLRARPCVTGSRR